jgi:hypothetical protein
MMIHPIQVIFLAGYLLFSSVSWLRFVFVLRLTLLINKAITTKQKACYYCNGPKLYPVILLALYGKFVFALLGSCCLNCSCSMFICVDSF